MRDQQLSEPNQQTKLLPLKFRRPNNMDLRIVIWITRLTRLIYLFYLRHGADGAGLEGVDNCVEPLHAHAGQV